MKRTNSKQVLFQGPDGKEHEFYSIQHFCDTTSISRRVAHLLINSSKFHKTGWKFLNYTQESRNKSNPFHDL